MLVQCAERSPCTQVALVSFPMARYL